MRNAINMDTEPLIDSTISIYNYNNIVFIKYKIYFIDDSSITLADSIRTIPL